MTRPTRWAAWGRDRGSASVVVAALFPTAIILIMMLLAASRISGADGVAASAAHDAARTATLQRQPGQAEAAARRAALAHLDQSGVRCSSVDVAVDASGLDAPLGQAATVTATVTCIAPLADLLLPGLPNSKTLTATGASVVDRHRDRTN